jgi:hypothetical protein
MQVSKFKCVCKDIMKGHSKSHISLNRNNRLCVEAVLHGTEISLSLHAKWWNHTRFTYGILDVYRNQ